MRVLVAEDYEAIAALLTQLLVEEGHDVRLVPDLHAAAPLAAEGCWDVVLLDGCGDGYDDVDPAARAVVRRIAARAPVVVGTARSWATRVAPAELGAAAVLAKPYDLDELLDALAAAARRGDDAPT